MPDPAPARRGRPPTMAPADRREHVPWRLPPAQINYLRRLAEARGTTPGEELAAAVDHYRRWLPLSDFRGPPQKSEGADIADVGEDGTEI